MPRPTTAPALDKRKAAVLRAIVREYVRTGQPVGSKAVTERNRLQVSAATIRNDMGVLEDLGFIHQPFTSAGRVPTDLGYRWFVDNWPSAHWPDLPRRERDVIDGAFRNPFSDLEEALASTSQLLSEVTDATAVVSAPPSIKHRLQRLELLARSDGRITILLIADTGVVEQGIVELEPSAETEPDPDLDLLTRELSDRLKGVAFEDLAMTIESRPDGRHKAIASAIAKMVADRSQQRVFRGGTANILSPDKFGDLATAQGVVGAIERPSIVSELLEVARSAGTVLVFIGHEVPVEKMHSCAVIFAPYDLGDDRQGTLGVIGPTRMDYPHTISAVEAVARSLNRLLDPSEEKNG
ncbi:MAG: heat-inducible transcriptional repressor HrcA [Actinomycetota bacterium]